MKKTTNKDFNKEQLMNDLEEQTRLLQEKIQNDFADKLLDMVENFKDKMNNLEYQATSHEYEVYQKICSIMNAMQTWF